MVLRGKDTIKPGMMKNFLHRRKLSERLQFSLKHIKNRSDFFYVNFDAQKYMTTTKKLYNYENNLYALQEVFPVS
jgi:hypothetical protein